MAMLYSLPSSNGKGKGPALPPAQQLAKGEEEGEKVRAGKAKKVPYTLLMPPDQLEALRNLAEKDDTSVS
ncbi:hypothetical protein, partial [Pseudomonas aeruginosa]|uniref:hypothetical protein n=1 Tax=Pseudomonas aeruginosa TaxID=287 RepID=UPI0023B92D40